MPAAQHRILFICTGNICRSPLAASVFLHKAAQRGVAERFIVESAGIGGWHAGEPPDPRARATASRHGIPMKGLARQITRRDLEQFDFLICLDESHREHVRSLGAPGTKLRLLMECDPTGGTAGAGCRDVPDPYYGGPEGFETCYTLIDRACDALLDELAPRTAR